MFRAQHGNCWFNSMAHRHLSQLYEDVIEWKLFPRYWPFVRGIHRSPVTSQRPVTRKALMFTLICVWTADWVNNRDAGDLRRHRAHDDVIVMEYFCRSCCRCYKLEQWRGSSEGPAHQRPCWYHCPRGDGHHSRGHSHDSEYADWNHRQVSAHQTLIYDQCFMFCSW